MKKVVMAAGIAVLLWGGSVAALAQSSTPEVDNANATITAQGSLSSTDCTGEDGVAYKTLKGSWAGTETEVTPGATDYSLSGKVIISTVSWTVNTATGRGYLTAIIALGSAAGPTYKGKLILVTDKPLPGTTDIPARGFIVAAFKPADDLVPPPGDDILVANTEFKIASGGASVSGIFGDAAGTFGHPNYSVVTNVPKDGVC